MGYTQTENVHFDSQSRTAYPVDFRDIQSEKAMQCMFVFYTDKLDIYENVHAPICRWK